MTGRATVVHWRRGGPAAVPAVPAQGAAIIAGCGTGTYSAEATFERCRYGIGVGRKKSAGSLSVVDASVRGGWEAGMLANVSEGGQNLLTLDNFVVSEAIGVKSAAAATLLERVRPGRPDLGLGQCVCVPRYSTYKNVKSREGGPTKILKQPLLDISLARCTPPRSWQGCSWMGHTSPRPCRYAESATQTSLSMSSSNPKFYGIRK